MLERTSGASAYARLRRPSIAALCLTAASLGGCDFPTGLPELESRWVVPAEETRFGVAELLPNAVSVTTAGNSFIVDFSPVTFSRTLGALCAACVDGVTAPKPPFLGSLAADVAFPAAVTSVSLVGGDVEVEIENQLGFDPIRPSASAFGDITVVVTDDADGDVLGTLLIDGTTTAFPTGTTLTRSMALAAASVEGTMVATVEVYSPLGDPVTIDVSNLLRATVTPTNVVVASVTIEVSGNIVSLEPVALDVSDIDQDLSDRIVAGGFILDVVNPFGVPADFQLTVDGPSVTAIQKAAQIGPEATSTIVIPLTVEELRRFLGEEDVVLTGSAVIDMAAPPITVTPGEELVLTGKFDITLRVGG